MRAISNPPNPWQSAQIEYLDEIPEAKLEVEGFVGAKMAEPFR